MKSCSLNALTAEVLHDTRRFSEQAPILTEVLSTRHFLSSIARIFHQFPIMEAENKDNMKSKSSRIIEKKGSSKEKSHIDCLQTKIITFSLMPKWKKMESSIFIFHVLLLFLDYIQFIAVLVFKITSQMSRLKKVMASLEYVS